MIHLMKLYLSQSTLEDVLEICKIESSRCNSSIGRSDSLKNCNGDKSKSHSYNWYCSKMIDIAEDRENLKNLDTLSLRQPENSIIHDFDAVESEAGKIGFPMVVRPSYVLGGRAMAIVNDHTDKKLTLI